MNKYIQPIVSFLENNYWSIDETEFVVLQYDIVDEMEADKIGFEITQDILELMEKYPLVEFGTPGPLTHFIEKFYQENKESYERILKQSVEEKPTIHTVWLLNRVINGSKNPEKLIETMQAISKNESLHEEIRNVAKSFLE